MDRGAHFLKSDFQIHSPRDGQWHGSRPVLPLERLNFAKSFVARCREKDLGAIAVTDHHDICFIKYVQLAAQDGEIDGFDPQQFVPDPARQRPIVFPGVELTLQVPCQALVLLDATATVETQQTLLNVLGLAPIHPDDAQQGPQVQRLPFQTLQALDTALKANASLRGRYILLPNLNEGGQDTLLRNGFQHQYAEMPCVGGYTEKDYSGFGTGHLNKLAGGDPNYGSRAVGIFQTSDARREDFHHLACRTTWVKLAEPTAEALRQACLARESRLFQSEPRLPSRFISRVEVSASLYLGAMDVELNPQFNALIGGRGTGKSTLLEYIRWAMQDDPREKGNDSAVDRKRQHFLDTLTQVDGVVRVHWLVDGTPHVVEFKPARNVLTLTVGQEAERTATADEVRAILPIRAFSQKQLSSVSGDRSELQSFVEEPIRDRLRQLSYEFDATRAELRNLYTTRSKRRDLTAQQQVHQTRLNSIQERIKTLQSTLRNLTPEAERALQEHSQRLLEQGYVDDVDNHVRSVLDYLSAVSARLLEPHKPQLPSEATPQSAVLERIEKESAAQLESLVNAVREASTSLRTSWNVVEELVSVWQGEHDRHLAVMTLAQSQHEENAAVLAQLQELRQDEAQALQEVQRLSKSLTDSPDPEAALDAAWQRWRTLHADRSSVVIGQCRALATASAGRLEVELHPGQGVGRALSVLESKLQGARIHPNRWEALRSWLSEDGLALQRWSALSQDLLAFLEASRTTTGQSGSPPVLPSWELTDQMRLGIRQTLSSDDWMELATVTIDDIPVFFYTGGGTRIAFEQASAGQQATVLLALLLNEERGPLIIDQPEDDLDNDVVGRVVDEIRRTKQDRQLLFASHNANLVVNGDAELVVQFRSIVQEGRTRGVIENQGAIDSQPVRDAITTVMEGGRKAFDLRRQKYGF